MKTETNFNKCLTLLQKGKTRRELLNMGYKHGTVSNSIAHFNKMKNDGVKPKKGDIVICDKPSDNVTRDKRSTYYAREIARWELKKEQLEIKEEIENISCLNLTELEKAQKIIDFLKSKRDGSPANPTPPCNNHPVTENNATHTPQNAAEAVVDAALKPTEQKSQAKQSRNNKHLNKAKSKNKSENNKNDEAYTKNGDIQLFVISILLVAYPIFFKNKTVYCNCDDSKNSNFWKFFVANFSKLGLKKLICTGYVADGNGLHQKAMKAEYDGKNFSYEELKEDGSYDSQECRDFAKEADFVITNPPFSLLNVNKNKHSGYIKFIAELKEERRDMFHYAFIGPTTLQANSLPYNLISKDLMRVIGSIKKFDDPNGEIFNDGTKKDKSVSTHWFTSIPLKRESLKTKNGVIKDGVIHRVGKKDVLIPFEKYNCKNSMNAIEVKYLKWIPANYDGIMAVPCTFMKHFDPNGEYKILGKQNSLKLESKEKRSYVRILIQRTGNYSIVRS
jgi:hypothetical protein